jgi:hypothetical protein
MVNLPLVKAWDCSKEKYRFGPMTLKWYEKIESGAK